MSCCAFHALTYGEYFKCPLLWSLPTPGNLMMLCCYASLAVLDDLVIASERYNHTVVAVWRLPCRLLSQRLTLRAIIPPPYTLSNGNMCEYVGYCKHEWLIVVRLSFSKLLVPSFLQILLLINLGHD